MRDENGIKYAALESEVKELKKQLDAERAEKAELKYIINNNFNNQKPECLLQRIEMFKKTAVIIIEL